MADVGDAVMRPQSEFKVSTPVDKPPSAPLSAPPNVIEQVKLDCKPILFFFIYVILFLFCISLI